MHCRKQEPCAAKGGCNSILNIYNTAISLYKPWKPKGSFQLEIIINVLALSASSTYLCYGSTAIINVLILQRWDQLNNLKSIPALIFLQRGDRLLTVTSVFKVDPRTERVQISLMSVDPQHRYSNGEGRAD